MLCEIHRNQNTIQEPQQQFANHLELGSFLMDKSAFAEAQEHLACAFEIFHRGLIPEDANVISCFARLLESLESQQREDLIPAYLEQGLRLQFKHAVRGQPALQVFQGGKTDDASAVHGMTKSHKWIKEARRLKTLRRYEILDTPPDGCFDRLTAFASKVFNIPIVIISLVDTDRIWFKSHHGLEGVEQIGRDPGLCASAILSDEIYLVEDAKRDPRTLANPLVCGDFGLRFYAAAPVHTHDGFNLGTICLIDKKQRYLNSDQDKLLADLAAIVMDELEIRLAARIAARQSSERIVELEQQINALTESGA